MADRKQEVKTVVTEILKKHNCYGSVWSDNLNGTMRILIEDTDASPEVKDIVSHEIRQKFGEHISVYI